MVISTRVTSEKRRLEAEAEPAPFDPVRAEIQNSIWISLKTRKTVLEDLATAELLSARFE